MDGQTGERRTDNFLWEGAAVHTQATDNQTDKTNGLTDGRKDGQTGKQTNIERRTYKYIADGAIYLRIHV